MSKQNDTSINLGERRMAMALIHRRPPANLLCHSDRGAQYASRDYRQALQARAGLHASMSRKGNCYDNAFIESFSSLPQTRAGLPHRLYHPRPGPNPKSSIISKPFITATALIERWLIVPQLTLNS